MFWNRTTTSSPQGVPLSDLVAMLAPTTIKATITGDTLTAQHEHYAIRIEVRPPASRDSENGPIKAVVRVIADLPAPIVGMFRGREAPSTAAFNSLAALGALYQDEGTVRIGSRLTIYENESAWKTLQSPLLAFTAICGSEAILGGIRRTLINEKPRSGASLWSDRDLAKVGGYLSKHCVCTPGDLGLTAEFELTGDSSDTESAQAQDTALFQLMADQPHPELGGGLFGLLQLPQQVADRNRLAAICLHLNQIEMATDDLPPHFGAWCPGQLGNNLAYVTFLPNALHSVAGIAVNIAFWAIGRAQWANAQLKALGVPS